VPELRRSITSDRWVIVAPERAKRPSDFAIAGAEFSDQPPEGCPFCAGNEAMTPPEIYRTPPGDRWSVRVVPNKFPALQPGVNLEHETGAGLYERVSGMGAHEVVIETPEHDASIPDLADDQLRQVIDTYVLRLQSLMEDPQLRYVQLFKNHGLEAGASLLHPHSQIIATPIVPQEVRDSVRIAIAHYEREERCIFCDVLRAETEGGDRLVDERDGFVVWAPYASRFPFELVACPRTHSHDFTSMTSEQREGLARTLKRTLARLRTLLGDVPYNLVLRTAPNTTRRPEEPAPWPSLPSAVHWRIAIMPRLPRIAGFEWGTGLYINPMPPEQAAGYLRDIELPN